MKKALVIGGTRFFGVHLVKNLLKNGWAVTIATRGTTQDEFGEQVSRIQVDRRIKEDMRDAFAGKFYDVIYDQICYSSYDALEAINLFKNKTNKYIVTSSMSVYGKKRGCLREEDFDPYHYPLLVKTPEEVAYDEGKRLMEAAFFQKAPFPVSAVRFPIVLGENDYTERLLFYIQEIDNNQPVYFDAPEAEISFIYEKEAGRFLCHLAEAPLTGPVNAASDHPVTIQSLLEEIEKVTGKKADVRKQEIPEKNSPYGITESWTLNTEKAVRSGFSFESLPDYLPDLISNVYHTFVKQ